MDFDILSGGIFFTHAIGRANDWILERPNEDSGSGVFLRLDNATTRTTLEIIEQFADVEDEQRSSTRPVKRYDWRGTATTSRSHDLRQKECWHPS